MRAFNGKAPMGEDLLGKSWHFSLSPSGERSEAWQSELVEELPSRSGEGAAFDNTFCPSPTSPKRISTKASYPLP